MVGTGLVLRVFDFGEAYHPSICSEDYKPGFTLQYSAPEYFQRPCQFDEKSDVYGLGVTLYETLFQRNPLAIPNFSEAKLQANI